MQAASITSIGVSKINRVDTTMGILSPLPDSIRRVVCCSALFAATHLCGTDMALAQSTPRTMGIIEWLDPAFEQLVPKDSQMEVIGDGFQWAEGPVWIRDGGFLLFSDVLTN